MEKIDTKTGEMINVCVGQWFVLFTFYLKTLIAHFLNATVDDQFIQKWVLFLR